MDKQKQPIEHRLLNDPSVSNWLKEQIVDSKSRDVLDSMKDAETLLMVCHERWNTLETNAKKTLRRDSVLSS